MSVVEEESVGQLTLMDDKAKEAEKRAPVRSPGEPVGKHRQE